MSFVFTPAHRGGSGPPLVCLHGFTDTWRTWELILPALERRHDVLALALPGHAGGPPLARDATVTTVVDELERMLDQAGFATAHIVGNSLGAHLALHLAARGRARSVVALAPAGGWTQGDDSFHQTLDYFKEMQHLLRTLAPHAEQIVSTPAGRRRATLMTTSNFEHIPAELLAHQMCGVVACQAIDTFIEIARRDGWNLDPERIECPVRVVWGTADKVLAWPSSAARYRSEWAAQADWVVLDDVGHCPQLDVPLETAQLILDFTASRARAASGGAMPDGQHAANPRSRSE